MRTINERVILSSAGSSTTTAGALATNAWLRALGLTPPVRDHWSVEVVLDTVANRAAIDTAEMIGTRFRIEIYRGEWGFAFSHQGRVSWIRVTEVPLIHGADDHRLLERTPPLKRLSELVQAVEREHGITFHRASAAVSTTVPKLEPIARNWLSNL